MTSVKAAGDAALLLETGPDDRWAGGLGVQEDNEAGNGPAVGGTPASVAAAIRAAGLTGLIDVVPGARTVLVTFELGSWAPGELAQLLQRLAAEPGLDEADDLGTQFIERRQRGERLDAVWVQGGLAHRSAEDHEFLVPLGKVGGDLRRSHRIA